MNVKDDVVEASVPVAARGGDESEEIMELTQDSKSEDTPSPQSAKSLKSDDIKEEQQEQAGAGKGKPGIAAHAKKPRKKGVWKKPPGMPKRPLSAYNLFFRQMRLELLGDEDSKKFEITDQSRRKHRVSHGKFGFKELATMIGAKWKALPAEERKVYEDQARLEKMRYKKELEEWKKAGGSSKPAAKSPPPAQPTSSSGPASAPVSAGAGQLQGGPIATIDNKTQQQYMHDKASPRKEAAREAAEALAGISDERSISSTGASAMMGSASVGGTGASSALHRASLGFGSSPTSLRSPVSLQRDAILLEQGRAGFAPLQPPLGDSISANPGMLFPGGGGGPLSSSGGLMGSVGLGNRPYSLAASMQPGVSGGGSGDSEEERRRRMQQLYELHLAEARFLRDELERAGSGVTNMDPSQEQRMGLAASSAGFGGGGLSSSMRSYGTTDPLSVSTSTGTSPPEGPSASAASTAAAASQEIPFRSTMMGGQSSTTGSVLDRMFQSPSSQVQIQHQHQHQQQQQQQPSQQQGGSGTMGYTLQQQQQLQQSQDQQLRAQEQQLLQMQQTQRQQHQQLQALSSQHHHQLGDLPQQQQQQLQQQQQQHRLSLPLYNTGPSTGSTSTAGSGGAGGMDMGGRAQRLQMLEDALQAERARQLEDEIRMFLHRRNSGGGGGGGGSGGPGGGPGGGM